MADIKWYLQGNIDTEIDKTDVLLFADMYFNSGLLVGDYNKTTHVKTDLGVNKSDGNEPNNNRYVSINKVSINEGTNKNLNTVSNAEAIIKLEVENDTDFTVEDAIIYLIGNNIDFQIAEIGNTNFTKVIDITTALQLNNKTTPAKKHTYYLVASMSPATFGTLSSKLKFQGVFL